MAHRVTIKSIEDKLLNSQLDLSSLSADQQFALIMSKVADIPDAVVRPKELLDLLKESKRTGQPLKVKFGIDPTGPEIHIGHAVSLINLRRFQRMGHEILLVIGDFTAMIGDPSDRMSARPALTEQDILENMSTYEQQASRIIDLKASSIEKHYNSKWMRQLSLRQWVETLKRISLADLIQSSGWRL